MTKSYGVILTK